MAFYEGNQPMTSGFPAQRANDLESIPMLWLDHLYRQRYYTG